MDSPRIFNMSILLVYNTVHADELTAETMVRADTDTSQP